MDINEIEFLDYYHVSRQYPCNLYIDNNFITRTASIQVCLNKIIIDLFERYKNPNLNVEIAAYVHIKELDLYEKYLDYYKVNYKIKEYKKPHANIILFNFKGDSIFKIKFILFLTRYFSLYYYTYNIEKLKYIIDKGFTLNQALFIFELLYSKNDHNLYYGLLDIPYISYKQILKGFKDFENRNIDTFVRSFTEKIKFSTKFKGKSQKDIYYIPNMWLNEEYEEIKKILRIESRK